MSWNGKLFFAGILAFFIYTIASGYSKKWIDILTKTAT